ncbi:MAG: hypothetical protein ACD_26C00104G0001 [uncultured bacterium]|nr:MAG: hypothetical protein ACD_26C00104G0001 [uncultured bacterium]
MFKTKINISILLVCIVVFAFFGYFKEARKPIEYTGSITVSVFQNQETTNQFAYQNYYLWQSNNLYLDNIRDMLTTPTNIKQIFKDAQTDINGTLLIDNFSKIFDIKKSSGGGSTAIISYTDTSNKNVSSVLNSLSLFINKKIDEYKQSNFIPNEMNIIVSDQIIDKVDNETLLSTLFGLLAGAIFGLIIILFKEYAK